MDNLDNNLIHQALDRVKDPQTGQSILARRMVEQLQIRGQEVHFTIVLPSMNYPHKQELNFACMASINEFYPQAEVHIHLRAQEQNQQQANPNNPLPQVRNLIAVASGKGGVGKSTVALNLALGLKALGARVGLMDADVYGPSAPTMLGLQGQRPKIQDLYGEPKMLPIEKYGLPSISIGYIIEAEQAIVLRGPRLGGIIRQFFQDCLWGELDYLIIDLPPGTGDVQLSLVQTAPITGVVMVTTPQEVALADAVKGMNMFRLPNVNVPILGVVENMAWFSPKELPQNKYFIFGEGGGKKLAKMANTMLLGQVPLVQGIREGGDKGLPALLDGEPQVQTAFMEIARNVARQVALRNEFIEPSKTVELKD